MGVPALNHVHNKNAQDVPTIPNPESSRLVAGKIPPGMLEEIVFKRKGKRREEVLIYPGIGEDTTVVDMGEEFLVASTDPITGAEDMAGWLAVKVALNDIGASGAEPICILVTLLLPEDTQVSTLVSIMDDVDRACREENVSVAGGHSEVTPGLTRPLISITALGRSRGRRVLRPTQARAGQDLVLTKWAGMEGTSILVRDFAEAFAGVLDAKEAEEARNLFFNISVTLDGKIAWENGASSGHDATEGGVLGAIYELCEASSLGVVVYADRVPVLEITRKVARFTGIDPLKLISSGCLLVAAADGPGLCHAYAQAGINAAVVGKLTTRERRVIRQGESVPLEAPASDELWHARHDLQNRGFGG